MAKGKQSEEAVAPGQLKATASTGRGYWWHVRKPGGKIVAVYNTKVEAVMSAAERSGLLGGKTGRIGGRVSPQLVEKAKARTGIEADTDLIEFALATLAVEDKFAEAFKAVRGSVDPDLDLGF
jgi:hypothetical protein